MSGVKRIVIGIRRVFNGREHPNITRLQASLNGSTRCKGEEDMGARLDTKYLPGKLYPSGPGFTSDIRSCNNDTSLPRDWMVYLTTCLIGYPVDVQVKNGSIYSGIFHASNAGRDFGIVLKMARLLKDTSSRGTLLAAESFNKSPFKTLIIPAHELVQVVAKDIPVTREGINCELLLEKQDLLLDSCISKIRQADEERELKPWVPDEDVPQHANLDNTFTRHRIGSWDQFQVNEQLFGVKSTFNEEIYTTKLERGPMTWEREQEALRLAREIEGEDTDDLHLAEERGVDPHNNIEIDEETRYSSVFRGVEDSGYGDEGLGFDSRNADTFCDSSGPSTGRTLADVAYEKAHHEDSTLASTSLMNDVESSQQTVNRELFYSGSPATQRDDGISNAVGHGISTTQAKAEEISNSKDSIRELLLEEHQTCETEAADSVVMGQGKHNSEASEDAVSGNVQPVAELKSHRGQPTTLASPISLGGSGSSALKGPALSPSSSVGSLSSEKSSTLNPHAKEFKFNPNAKSFVPLPAPVRPMSPVADNSFYYPPNMPVVQNMHGMPVGIEIGPAFPGPPPMMFNPHGPPMQAPQTYYAANQPQFGQHMMMAPRQVMYMPAYPPMSGQQEMYNKGRDY